MYNQRAMIQICQASSFDTIGSGAWHSLLAGSITNTIFQTYEWQIAWWRTYGVGHDLVLLYAVDETGMIGIAPMMVCREKNKKVLRFIGDGRSDYLDFIYSRGHELVVSAFLESIAGNWHRWDYIQLQNVPQHSKSLVYIKEYCRDEKLHSVSGPAVPCPALPLTDKEYVSKVVHKRSLVRHHSHFAKRPSFQVHHLTHARDILPHLSAFFTQHIGRWSITDTPSLFIDEVNRLFYRTLTTYLDSTDRVVFTIVKSEGIPIAYHFGFLYNNNFFWYKPSFDIVLSRFSPGEVLLKELLQFAVAQECSVFDFTVGGEAFKSRFSNLIQYNNSLTITRTPSAAFFFTTKGWVKHNKRLYNQICQSLLAGQALLQTVRTIGRTGLMARLVKRAIRIVWSFSSVNLYKTDARAPLPGAPPRSEGLEVQQGTFNDLLTLDCFESVAKKQKFLRSSLQRMNEGKRCYIVLQKGAIAGFGWVNETASIAIAEVETVVQAEPEAIVVFDCFTTPSFRGKGIYKYILQFLIRHYGDRPAYVYCEKSNVPSRKGIEHSFRLVKELHCMRVCGLSLRWSREN